MDGKTPWTKGPWSVEEEKTGISVIADDTGEPVCRIAEWAPHVDRADARLIAAAPALAEALEEVMEWVNNWSPDFIGDQEWPETEAKIDAALSQARGGK